MSVGKVDADVDEGEVGVDEFDVEVAVFDAGVAVFDVVDDGDDASVFAGNADGTISMTSTTRNDPPPPLPPSTPLAESRTINRKARKGARTRAPSHAAVVGHCGAVNVAASVAIAERDGEKPAARLRTHVVDSDRQRDRQRGTTSATLSTRNTSRNMLRVVSRPLSWAEQHAGESTRQSFSSPFAYLLHRGVEHGLLDDDVKGRGAKIELGGWQRRVSADACCAGSHAHGPFISANESDVSRGGRTPAAGAAAAASLSCCRQ